MTDPVIPKVPTIYEGTAKEEPTLPKVPTSYDRTPKEEEPPTTAANDDGAQ